MRVRVCVSACVWVSQYPHATGCVQMLKDSVQEALLLIHLAEERCWSPATGPQSSAAGQLRAWELQSGPALSASRLTVGAGATEAGHRLHHFTWAQVSIRLAQANAFTH